MLEAQLLSVADHYCAMVADRSYRSGLPPATALRQVLADRGRGINPQVAARLIRELGLYPPGSLVALANGEIAVVIRRGLQPNTPVVKSIRSATGIRLPNAPKRLTSKPPFTVERAVASQVLGDLVVDLPSLWEDTVVTGQGPVEEVDPLV